MNETHYIFCPLEHNYLFEEVTQQWIALPETDFDHLTGFCGLTTIGGTQELIVTSGPDNNKTEIFNFGSWTWRLGNDLPEKSRHHGLSAQYGKSFLVIGREDRDSIFYFNPDTYAWHLLPVTLENNRYWLSAVLVPEKLFLKQKTTRPCCDPNGPGASTYYDYILYSFCLEYIPRLRDLATVVVVPFCWSCRHLTKIFAK